MNFERPEGIKLLKKFHEDKAVVNVRLLFRESAVSQAQANEGPVRYSGRITHIVAEDGVEDYLLHLVGSGEGADQRTGKAFKFQAHVYFYASSLFAIEVMNEVEPSLIEVPKVQVAAR